MTKNLAVFVSGRGSNLQAIINKIESGYISCKLSTVVSDKTDCGAFEIARKNNITHFSVSAQSKEGFLTYQELLTKFSELSIDLIVLAGFLKKIPDELIELYQHRIMNIHPALLPSFGGKGMYGHYVHEAVFNKSCKVSGATVHFVDSIYDNGFIIAQRAVDISDVSSPDEIAERVLKVEHELLPYVIKLYFENKVLIKDNRVSITE